MATVHLEKALIYTSMLTTQKWYAMRVCRLYLTAQPLHTVTFLADEFSNWNKRVVEFYVSDLGLLEELSPTRNHKPLWLCE